MARASGSVSPEEALVGRARSGDEHALEQLIRRHYRRIFRWALVQVGDPDDADDVTQTVLLHLQRRLKSFRGRSKFDTWLYRVTRNASLQWLRGKRRRERLARRVAEERPEADGPDPLTDVQVVDTAAMIRRAFAELPGRQREIFGLVDLQGYAPAEVAEALGMNPVTVRANLCKARRAMRSRMLEVDPEIAEELKS